jgi:hypothetical protein
VTAAQALLKDVLGDQVTTGEPKVASEQDTSSTWSGFGKGKMDAGRGARTKRVRVKGQGWIDVNLN